MDLSDGEIKSKLNIISEIDPRILIPLNEKQENVDKLVRELGVKSITEESKLKYKRDDFTDEDYQLELIKLTKK
jgi:hypothetical protein